MLMNESAANVQTLQSSTATGTAYDLTYLCMQIRTHAQVIALADQRLAAVNNVSLRTETQMIRTTSQDHLTMAQQIAASVAASDATTACAPYGGVTAP